MTIQIDRELLAPARDDGFLEFRQQYYADASATRRMERRELTNESDFHTGRWERESPDNGQSWGEWRDVYREDFAKIPGGERFIEYGERNFHHPEYKHCITLWMERLFVGDHHQAYRRLWDGDANSFYDHSFITVRADDGEKLAEQLLAYEEGPVSGGLENPDYYRRNCAYALGNIALAANGDILAAMSVPTRVCCAISGIDVKEVFPSCPDLTSGLLVVRGAWNRKAQRYDLTFSRPVVISDWQSSRGIEEPTIVELPGGRIVVVFRGSNLNFPAWHTRIEPGTPGFKWYTCSDDGGLTFNVPRPWHFDSGEVIYSSSSFSRLFKSIQNRRCYWIGNITDPTRIHGNYPRYPLQIVELDPRYGAALKNTLTIIDDRRPGESELLQLSNFGLLQDRVGLGAEVYLAKLGQFASDGRNGYKGEAWKYRITFSQGGTADEFHFGKDRPLSGRAGK